jgi:protein gp37
MAERTAIAWTDHTYNPWIGCERISPACDLCYAAEEWGEGGRHERVVWGGPRSRTKTHRRVLKCNKAAAKAGERRRVFCASLADVFDNHRSIEPEWRSDLWALIDRCRALDWMLLTKRPQNIAKMLPPDWGDGWPHVWLGCTAENQTEADRRLPILLRIPAVVHFASVEPQLEAVDLRQYLAAGLDWGIVGGESGQSCRPFTVDWARELRDQCRAAGAAFFMKQLGGHPNKRDKLADMPADLQIREWPQQRAS